MKVICANEGLLQWHHLGSTPDGSTRSIADLIGARSRARDLDLTCRVWVNINRICKKWRNQLQGGRGSRIPGSPNKLQPFFNTLRRELMKWKRMPKTQDGRDKMPSISILKLNISLEFVKAVVRNAICAITLSVQWPSYLCNNLICAMTLSVQWPCLCILSV